MQNKGKKFCQDIIITKCFLKSSACKSGGKKKQNLNCILLPAPLVSHQKANLSLLLFSHTRQSPQQKFPHTSNFDMLVLASLSDQQAENLCQLECQTLDLPMDRPFGSSTGFWIWSITMEISYYQCWVGGSKGCCTQSLGSDSFRVSFKNCLDDDDFRFKKLVWFSGGGKRDDPPVFEQVEWFSWGSHGNNIWFKGFMCNHYVTSACLCEKRLMNFF